MAQALLSEKHSIYGNPWRADQWNITMQGQFVLRYGEAKGREFAKAAGVTFGATKPASTGQPVIIHRNFILNKQIGTVGQSSGGYGWTGDGPPDDDTLTPS